MLNSILLLSEKKKSKLLYHLLFWITLVLSFSFENISLYNDLGISNYLLLLFGRIFSIGLTIYINIQLAIPLLRRKKYFLYSLLVLFSIALLVITASFFNLLATSDVLHNDPFAYSSTMLLIYFFTGLRIVFLAYLLSISMEWIDQTFFLKELEIEKLQTEKQYLKNQLHPHFLFNTLNNLHGLVLTDKELASSSLLRFSDFLQYVVYSSEEKRVPLDKEIQLLQDYVALEQLRLATDKAIILHVQPSDKLYSIAPLLLLPLLENAVKHGIQRSGKNAFIKMTIQMQNNHLQVDVINSKGPALLTSRNGIGLKNLNRRLELEYPGRYSLIIRDEQETFTTHLQLSLDEV